MKRKSFRFSPFAKATGRRALIGISVILAAIAFTSCTSNNDNPVGEIDKPDVVVEDVKDILNGRLIFPVNVENLKESRLPVSTLKQVDLEVVKAAEGYSFEIEENEDGKYIVPVLRKEQTQTFETGIVKVTPKEAPEKARHVFFVFYKKDAAEVANARTRAASDGMELMGNYSNVIGSGTYRWAEVGNVVSSVFDYNKLYALAKENTNILKASQHVQTDMIELAGEDTEKTMVTWSANVGVSWKQPVTKKLTHVDVEVPNGENNQTVRKLQRVDRPVPKAVSGSVNLGINGMTEKLSNHEWYLNLLLVKTRIISMDMNRYEYKDDDTKPDFKTLASFINPQFVEDLQADTLKFQPERFFDSWGTDVITQGTFGGVNIYLYGRSENSYENSIGVDGTFSLTWSTPNVPNDRGMQFLEIFKMKNSPYLKFDAGGTYQQDNYEAATRSFKYLKTVGGNTALDPVAWESGMQSSQDTWQIISYRTSTAVEVSDSTCCLYPIEQVAQDIAAGYFVALSDEAEPTEADYAAVQRVLTNSETLYDAKAAYMEKHGLPKYERKRMVVADFMMKTDDDDRVKGLPKTFIGEDPRHPGTYRVYYPMMATKFEENYPGYAIETSCGTYNSGADTNDHYWYYALDTEDNCDGLIDVVAGWQGKDSERKKLEDDYYVLRGDNCQDGIVLDLRDKYVYVKFYDPGVSNADPNKKITAIAISVIEEDGPTSILASTGGSELKRNATESEYNAWKSWWTDAFTKEMKEERDDNIFYQKGGAHDVQFGFVYSTKTLPISRLNEKTICHPLKWGE